MPIHLSPQLKLFMQTAAGEDRCLLIASLKRRVDAEDLARLAATTGCEVRHSTGDLMTLVCNRAALEQLVRWPGLRSLEMSSPLFPESR